jgi:Heavy metal associated domain 2
VGIVAIQEIINTTRLAPPTGRRPELPKASVHPPRSVLRSRVPGRGRWHVKALEDSPRLAATVELILRREDGIESAEANPLTGSILVRFQPEIEFEWVEAVIQRALEFGPMSREEFSELRPKPAEFFSLRHLLAAEIGCSAFKMALFSGCCPAVLAAAGVLFLLHRRS